MAFALLPTDQILTQKIVSYMESIMIKCRLKMCKIFYAIKFIKHKNNEKK